MGWGFYPQSQAYACFATHLLASQVWAVGGGTGEIIVNFGDVFGLRFLTAVPEVALCVFANRAPPRVYSIGRGGCFCKSWADGRAKLTQTV